MCGGIGTVTVEITAACAAVCIPQYLVLLRYRSRSHHPTDCSRILLPPPQPLPTFVTCSVGGASRSLTSWGDTRQQLVQARLIVPVFSSCHKD